MPRPSSPARALALSLAGPLALASALSAPGCARHRHAGRALPPPASVRAESATPEEPEPVPINNRESPVVEGWSRGDH